MSAGSLSRARRLSVIALGLLAVYSVSSALSVRSANERLTVAQSDTRDVSNKLQEIQQLRHAPKVAALQLESPAQIANRIAAALQVAELPESTLMKEEPSAPQRIQRTDFEIRATSIELAPATLSQILKFCEALRDPQTGTMVRDLTLSTPRNGESGGDEETWESQMILTQMIFSPKSP